MIVRQSKTDWSSFWTKAMEAPEDNDITASTNDAMRRAGGQRADTGDFEPRRTSEETRQADGGDLSGEPGMGDIEDVAPDEGGGGNDPAGELDDFMNDGADAGGGDAGDDMGGDAAGGGDAMGGDEDATKVDNAEQAMQIYNLQKKMAQFYKVLTNTCNSLANYSAPCSSEELRDVYNKAVNHLSAARDLLFDLLTTSFNSANYADKLRKYVALRHVYSTILNVLDLHFDTLDQMMQSEKSSK